MWRWGGGGGGIPIMVYIMGRPKRGTFSRMEDKRVEISQAEV